MASIEMGHREIPEGKFCTTEEIIEYFETQQIPVCRIGMMQEGKARVIMRGEIRCYLNKPTAKGDRS